jgi:hypothetical protein
MKTYFLWDIKPCGPSIDVSEEHVSAIFLTDYMTLYSRWKNSSGYNKIQKSEIMRQVRDLYV